MIKSLTNVLIFTTIASVLSCTLIAIYLVLNPSNTQEAYDSLIKIFQILGIVAIASIISLTILKMASKN